MDKFGVFNLLSSLLNKTGQENSTNSNDFSIASSDKPQQSSKPTAPPLPLQAGMINTMTNHDEFIKRVKQKNKN